LRLFAARTVLMALLAGAAVAAPGIKDVRMLCAAAGGPAGPTISVYFNLPAPAAGDIVIKTNWLVRFAYEGSAYVAQIDAIGTSGLSSSGRADITLSGMVPANPVSALVQYSGPSGASTWESKLHCGTKTARTSYDAAAGKDKADIYVSGSASPAVGVGPSVVADVNLGLRFQQRATTSWQIAGSAKGDARKKVDPDSYRVRGAWVYESPRRLAFTSDLGGGMEFARQGKGRNVIFSPRLRFVPLGGVLQTEGKLKAAAALEIRGGIEGGVNTNDKLRFSSINFDGGYSVFRGVPGTTLYLRFFNPTLLRLKFKTITIRGDYDVRLLAKPELFLETRIPPTPKRDFDKDPDPQWRMQPRNYVNTEINLKLSDALGFTVKYEHGSLPPAFVYLRNKLSIGILLQLKERRGMRP
jgi:hypothetical protein